MQPQPMNTARALSCPQNGQTSTVTSPVLSKPLTSWLLDEPTDAKAIDVIAKSDLLRSEAAIAMPAIRAAALRPATEGEIRDIIGSRFATYPQPERDTGEAAAFWADYFDALGGLTPAQIEGGMKAHVADPKSEFLPKPGRLADLARQSSQPGRWTRAYNRARAAVVQAQKAEAPAPETAVRHSPEEIQSILAEVQAAMAETPTAKALAARKAALKPTPSAPLPAGSGMSAEMRAKLEREGAILPIDHDHQRAA